VAGAAPVFDAEFHAFPGDIRFGAVHGIEADHLANATLAILTIAGYPTSRLDIGHANAIASGSLPRAIGDVRNHATHSRVTVALSRADSKGGVTTSREVHATLRTASA
jgi:hypothetical protein